MSFGRRAQATHGQQSQEHPPEARRHASPRRTPAARRVPEPTYFNPMESGDPALRPRPRVAKARSTRWSAHAPNRGSILPSGRAVEADVHAEVIVSSRVTGAIDEVTVVAGGARDLEKRGSAVRTGLGRCCGRAADARGARHRRGGQGRIGRGARVHGERLKSGV